MKNGGDLWTSRICPVCGAEFTPYRLLHKYCSESCRRKSMYCRRKLEVGKVKKICAKAKKENITLIDIPIRHLGTEKSHELYGKIEKYLLENGIDILFDIFRSTLSEFINSEGLNLSKIS